MNRTDLEEQFENYDKQKGFVSRWMQKLFGFETNPRMRWLKRFIRSQVASGDEPVISYKTFNSYIEKKMKFSWLIKRFFSEARVAKDKAFSEIIQKWNPGEVIARSPQEPINKSLVDVQVSGEVSKSVLPNGYYYGSVNLALSKDSWQPLPPLPAKDKLAALTSSELVQIKYLPVKNLYYVRLLFDVADETKTVSIEFNVIAKSKFLNETNVVIDHQITSSDFGPDEKVEQYPQKHFQDFFENLKQSSVNTSEENPGLPNESEHEDVLLKGHPRVIDVFSK